MLLKQGNGIGFGDVDNLGNVHADQFSWDYSWGNVKQKTFRQIWDNVSDSTIAAYKYRRPLIKGRCGGVGPSTYLQRQLLPERSGRGLIGHT